MTATAMSGVASAVPVSMAAASPVATMTATASTVPASAAAAMIGAASTIAMSTVCVSTTATMAGTASAAAAMIVAGRARSDASHVPNPGGRLAPAGWLNDEEARWSSH